MFGGLDRQCSKLAVWVDSVQNCTLKESRMFLVMEINQRD